MSNLMTLPPLLLEVNGSPLRADEQQGLVQVRVQQRLSIPTLCELYFHAGMGSLQAVEKILPGAALRVRLLDQATALFVGVVTALEYSYGPIGQQELCIRSYDVLHGLRQQQTVQVHLDLTVADLARKLTGSGITVQAAEEGPRWPMLFQHRQNDLALLVEIAASSGLYLTLHEQTLHLLTLAGAGTPEALTLGESLLEARFEMNADAATGPVAATGWNPLGMATYHGSANQARSGRSSRFTTDAQPMAGTTALLDEAAPTAAHAMALAQAELDQRQARALSLWGVAGGNPALRPGVPVEIKGVAEQFAGHYVITEATHLLDGEVGFVTEISTLPPPIRTRARGSVATLGVVIQVDDSEDLGRIRVKLPTFQDVESGWLAVLLPAAGPNKGFIALPDVGDRVLVLLTHENPGQGIVLGGLYGGQRLPDSGVTGAAVRRYTWVTPGGQKIQLDDDRSTIRLENSSGSYIELNHDDIIIAAQAIDLRKS